MLSKEERKYLWDYTQIFEPNKATNQVPPPAYYQEYAKNTTIETQWIDTVAGKNRIDLVQRDDRPKDSPVFVYFYGGAWGNPQGERHDWFCRRLASETNYLIVNCHYALSGVAGFPIPEYEGYDVCKWVSDNAQLLGIDPGKIIVGGGSSGGSLANAVAMINVEKKGFEIAQLVLIYPVHRHDIIRADNLLLRLHNMLHCESPEDENHPLATPIHAPDEAFQGYPEVVYVTDTKDFLLEEEKELIQRFISLNIPVNFRIHEGIHGYLVRWLEEYDEAIIDMEAQMMARMSVIDIMRNRRK